MQKLLKTSSIVLLIFFPREQSRQAAIQLPQAIPLGETPGLFLYSRLLKHFTRPETLASSICLQDYCRCQTIVLHGIERSDKRKTNVLPTVIRGEGFCSPPMKNRRRSSSGGRFFDVGVMEWMDQSSFSTSRNAFCGTSTFPNCLMRRLPSFCFSSSFRLRVMSPP